MIDYKGVQIHYRKGTKVMLIKAFDRSLFACVNLIGLCLRALITKIFMR